MASKDAAQGEYRIVWDGMDNNNTPVAAGNYFVQIKIAEKCATRQIMLIK